MREQCSLPDRRCPGHRSGPGCWPGGTAGCGASGPGGRSGDCGGTAGQQRTRLGKVLLREKSKINGI